MSADRLATLKLIVASSFEGKAEFYEDEIAAIEWAVAAAERERVYEEALIALEENERAGFYRFGIARDALKRAALDRAGKGTS